MNAKTTKFLAVLAVLAMAFAGVAVLAQEQINDADEVTATTAATYDKDVISEAGISKIKLEETAGAKSVVLYKNAGKDADNKPIAATNIAGGNAYYVNVDSIIVIPNGPSNTWDNVIFTFFVLEGKEVNFVTANPLPAAPAVPETWTDVTAVRLISVASEEDGVITLNEARAGETAFATTGYAGAKVTAGNYNSMHAEYTGYKAIDKNLELGDNDYSVKMKAKYGVANNFYFTDGQVISVVADTIIEGNIPIVFFPYNKTEVTFVNFTGTVCNAYDDATGEIINTSATIELKNFTGKVKSAYGIKTPLGNLNAFAIEQTGDGAIKATNKYAAILLEDGSMIKFAEGATVDGVFGHVDEYGDWHAIGGDNDNEKPMTAGIDGLIISADGNKVVLRGNVQLEANTTLAMLGNVTISGMIYTTKDSTSYNLTLGNSQADIKLAGLQVVGNGKVTLATSVLVTAGTSFLVKGALEVSSGAVLKVAEKAVVKAEGKLTMGAAVMDGTTLVKAAAAIWNAGQVIVPNYIKTEANTATNPATPAEYYDAQMIRVYMNSTAGTGKFFAGSVEYDGTGAGAPLAVAYGAYLDVTGKCSVNLTSGGITVVNNLYKYNTMILATKDTTIPLTLDYNNQYPAKFNLKGKDYSGPETTAQSAVYRNVVWETPSVATIYVTAPEVYTVTLVKEYNEDADKTIKSVWTDGLIVKDLQGRIIPISQESGAYKGGDVKLVFGEKYTITGDVEENDYSFVDLKNVFSTLKKDSQTQGSFTMIRNLETDGTGKEIPAEIQVKMGKATVVTVKLTDAEKRIAAGDVILSYSVDDGKTYKDVVKPAAAADAITFKVFSNQTVLLKYPAIEYFEFDAVLNAVSTAADAVPYNVTDKTTDLTDKQKKAGWINAFKITSDAATKVKATIGITCALDAYELEFVPAGADKDAILTITFEEGKYYTGTSGHDAVVKYDFSEVNSGILTVYKGEVFSMSWTDVPDVREKMTYVAGVADRYSISVTQPETGGEIAADATEAKAGQIVTVTATPATGYKLGAVYVDQNPISGTTFEMPAEEVTVTAVFVQTSGTANAINVTQGDNGTVTANKTTAIAGETVVLTVEPATGYKLTSLKYNTTDISLTDTFFVMPSEAVTVTATFAEDDNANNDATNTPAVTGTEYKSGTAFTVDNDYTFTLTLTEIIYVDVKNGTNTQAVITDNDVAKSGVVLEAQKLKEKAIEQVNENLVKLSVEGSYVISWSYKLTVVQGTGDNAKTGYATGTVSGASAMFNFQNVKGTSTEGEVTGNVTTMEITTINSERIVYWVQINQDENLRYDKYSAGGYMNDVMKVWATPATGFNITKIDVYLWSQATGKGAWYAEAVKDESAGETGTTVWTYTMPASDVLLVPDVDSNYATITYKNEDGTVLQETPQLKGALPVYSGATPTKPATATETYEFAGWSPTPVIVTEDATYVAQFRTVEPTSEDVSVTIGQKGQAINVVLYAIDGKNIGTGSIELLVWFTYIDEEGDIMTDKVKVPLTYNVEGKTANVIVDTTFIQLLGDNYGAAYAVTGTYTLGSVQGDIIRTAYTPVEA